MEKLRNVGLVMLAAIVLLSVAGIIFAFYEVWTVAIGLLFISVVVSLVTTLLTTRYISRNARTGERGTKISTQKLSARVRESMKQQQKANAELRALIGAVREDQRQNRESQDALQSTVTELESKITEVGERVTAHSKSTKQHLTTTVRDGTRQVESLVHIYQRYPEVKLPMPPTGRWAIDGQALAHLIALVEEHQPQRILELGSGTSTIWLGYLCRSFGGNLVTLDHLEHFLGLTRTAIDRHQLHDVIDSRLAPLEPIESDGKAFNWYALNSMTDLSDIDMVIIDGPPASTGPQARYPALPELIERLAPNVTIILDDAHRNDEAEIVESWLTEYPTFKEIEHGTSRLAVLQRTSH